jgi:hypothetical protein
MIAHSQALGAMEEPASANCFVGIDVGKRQLDVHILPSGTTFSVARDAAGLEQLVAKLRPHAPRLIVLEATGGLEVVVCAHLAAAGLAVVAINPRQIRAFAVALGRRAKTDRLDAVVIARQAACDPLHGHPGRCAPQQHPRCLPCPSHRRRQAAEGRPGRLHAQAAAHPQRHHPDQPAMARSSTRIDLIPSHPAGAPRGSRPKPPKAVAHSASLEPYRTHADNQRVERRLTFKTAS